MSLFCAEFLRNAGEHLRIEDNDPPNVNITPMPYLFLAQTQEQADTLERNWKMQCQLGAKVALLSQAQLRTRFPFMHLDDVIMGTLGLENEGAIDGWQVLQALREKNIELGVQYVKVRAAAAWHTYGHCTGHRRRIHVPRCGHTSRNRA